MKKLFILLCIFSCLIFSGCKDIKYDYTIRNLTEYTVTILDTNTDNYILNPFQNITIQHANSAHFTLASNPYPIYLENYFTLTEIDYLKTFEIYIYNTTSNTYTLNINNDPFKQEYSITPGEYTIEIYVKTPSLKLLLNNTQCNNYVFQNNTIYIF